MRELSNNQFRHQFWKAKVEMNSLLGRSYGLSTLQDYMFNAIMAIVGGVSLKVWMGPYVGIDKELPSWWVIALTLLVLRVIWDQIVNFKARRLHKESIEELREQLDQNRLITRLHGLQHAASLQFGFRKFNGRTQPVVWIHDHARAGYPLETVFTKNHFYKKSDDTVTIFDPQGEKVLRVKGDQKEICYLDLILSMVQD